MGHKCKDTMNAQSDIKVLGICGREGAGKTTVANVLTGGSANRFTRGLVNDPIKYIVHIIFGFSLDGKLSDPNEKDPIWGLSYQEATGTIINLLHAHVDTQWCVKFPPQDRHEPEKYTAYFSNRQSGGSGSANGKWAEFSFADALKQIAAVIFNLDFDMLLAQTPEDRERRERETTQEFNRCGAITGRYALEYLGTDVFRNHFDNDVWIKIANREAKSWMNQGGKVVIPDVRFPNELTFIDNVVDGGGTLLVLYRDAQDLLLTAEDRASHPAKWKFLDFCGDAKNLKMFHNVTGEGRVQFLKAWATTNFLGGTVTKYCMD